jgi:hypothetical protein
MVTGPLPPVVVVVEVPVPGTPLLVTVELVDGGVV